MENTKFEKQIEKAYQDIALSLSEGIVEYLKTLEDPEDITCNPYAFELYWNFLQRVLDSLNWKK